MIIDSMPIEVFAALFLGIIGLFVLVGAIRMPRNHNENKQKREEIRRMRAQTEEETELEG